MASRCGGGKSALCWVVNATKALTRLHVEIRACTRCVAAGYLAHARPIVAGSASDRVMLIGQAPGDVEVREGRPFAGRSGAELNRWLAQAGLSLDEVYRSAVTKCFPGEATNGEGDRRPSPAEVALCAPWLERELALLRPRIVLLVGALAIERFWGKVPLDEAVGRSRTGNGIVFIPLPHPSGTSRWLNDSKHRALLRRALGILKRELRTA